MSDIELKPCPSCGSKDVKYAHYDDAVSVYCRNCRYEIHSRRLEKFAAERWNSLHRPPQWTTETPTEPGWYWNRVAGKESLPMRLYYDSDGEYCYQVAGLPDECWLVSDLADEVGCEWAGPIHEPQEAKQ